MLKVNISVTKINKLLDNNLEVAKRDIYLMQIVLAKAIERAELNHFKLKRNKWYLNNAKN